MLAALAIAAKSEYDTTERLRELTMTERDTSDWRRGLVVANPRAGSFSERLVEEVLEACAPHVDCVERIDTDGPDTAVRQIAEAVARWEPDVLVVVGGDGTVRAAAESVHHVSASCTDDDVPATARSSPPRLLVIPAGSGNSAFSLLWGDASWRDAVADALGGTPKVRRADLIGVLETAHPSLIGVNFGLVARVAETIERMKAASDGKHSPEERYWTAFSEVLQDLRPFPTRVEIDGEDVYAGTVSMVTVGGVRSFGRGMFKLLPRSAIDDGLLDVCVVEAHTADEVAGLAALVPTGDHIGQPGVRYAQGRTVTVARDDGKPLSMEHDGDPHRVGSAVTLNVVPGAVSFLAADGSVTERG